MKVSKLVRIGILCVLLMVCNGCGFKVPKSKNAVYRSAEEEFTFLVEAIANKDHQAIKKRFSKYAAGAIEDLDEKIDRLIAEFPDYEGEYTIKDTFTKHTNRGVITNIYTPSFDFMAGEDEYRLRIIYYVRADEEPERMGYYSIQLYKRHDPSYSDKMYTHGEKDAPDILLWDYTKEQ